MSVFEKQQGQLKSAIEQQSVHYSIVPHEDLRETHNRLVKAILASTSAKYCSLSITLVESTNKHDFLTYALACRSMIEIVATLRHCVFKGIMPIVHEMASAGQYTAEQVQQLIIEEDKYFRGTRFDWVEVLENGFRSLIDRYPEWAKEKNEWRRLLDYVRQDVFETTNKQQQPFAYGSLDASEDFFFQ